MGIRRVAGLTGNRLLLRVSTFTLTLRWLLPVFANTPIFNFALAGASPPLFLVCICFGTGRDQHKKPYVCRLPPL
jgi:hypothetical protein